MLSNRPVLCIVGPTATGKSDLGIAIAKACGGEVLSADSMQVYRGMNIGTAKLTLEEMQGVPHHLIDLVNPDEPFTVADWKARADTIIADLHRRGRLPIVVGGTGLYVRAILDDLDFAGESGSLELREKWENFVREHGNLALHGALAERDPEAAMRLHPNDVRRIVRALEVFDLRDSPMSSTYDWRVRGGRYLTASFALNLPRQLLYERANLRVDRMMEQGLLAEVEELLAAGYSDGLASMQAIGYKELLAHLQRDTSLDDAVERVKQATRRYAKRQVSWFGRDPRNQWVDVSNGSLQASVVEPILLTATSLTAGIQVSGRE